MSCSVSRHCISSLDDENLVHEFIISLLSENEDVNTHISDNDSNEYEIEPPVPEPYKWHMY